jgi:hypothetical protein
VYKLIILAIIVAAAGLARAATYYVDSDDGRDDPTWNGGRLEPWQTLSYALERASGANTFMCRGFFQEEITVRDDDGGSTFVANGEAILKGYLATKECLRPVFLRDFQVDGNATAGTSSYLSVDECRFTNPARIALILHGPTSSLSVRDSVVANAEYGAYGTGEYSGIYFYDTHIADCAEGVCIVNYAVWGISGCRLERVAGAALDIKEAGGSARNTEFYDNDTALKAVYGGLEAAYGYVSDCVFRGNGLAVVVNVDPEAKSRFSLERNDVRNNTLNGLELSGDDVYARGNVVTGNGGHGVYITEDAPDLGTPGDPGGNTLAGNKSGYDVYNASPENIPAYGNTWDPQSEAEMNGKTWQEVNVTRIYDRWDDPDVGYVMWSEPMLGVAPASLGQIKASFKGGPTSGQAGLGRKPSASEE